MSATTAKLSNYEWGGQQRNLSQKQCGSPITSVIGYNSITRKYTVQMNKESSAWLKPANPITWLVAQPPVATFKTQTVSKLNPVTKIKRLAALPISGLSRSGSSKHLFFEVPKDQTSQTVLVRSLIPSDWKVRKHKAASWLAGHGRTIRDWVELHGWGVPWARGESWTPDKFRWHRLNLLGKCYYKQKSERKKIAATCSQLYSFQTWKQSCFLRRNDFMQAYKMVIL